MAEPSDNMDHEIQNPIQVLEKGMYHRLFSAELEITPGLSDVYELALAYYESRILTNDELIKNSAYFVKVDDRFTHHYFICTGDPLKIPDYSSSRLKSFFVNNQFRTGYATHGLFPYRGKFHPQMIKAIINIMGIKPGETILDPMMGSGTVSVEAATMGIKSIGIDASPFCQFMAQTKCDALKINPDSLNAFLKHPEKLFSDFKTLPMPMSVSAQKKQFFDNYPMADPIENERIFNLIFLAFLDSDGYARRSNKKTHADYFKSILERYIASIIKISGAMTQLKISPAEASLYQGDARRLEIQDNRVEGILFSPPYSFAIDYLKNDVTQLQYFETDIPNLVEQMIGLRGKTMKDKYHIYLEDMDRVLSECSRVLQPGRMCTIIIGTNDSQLSKALNIQKDKVSGLNRLMVEIGMSKGFRHVRSLPRQIVGMANTMRQEYIVMLQKLAE